jgi:hypothetical protein
VQVARLHPDSVEEVVAKTALYHDFLLRQPLLVS